MVHRSPYGRRERIVGEDAVRGGRYLAWRSTLHLCVPRGRDSRSSHRQAGSPFKLARICCAISKSSLFLAHWSNWILHDSNDNFFFPLRASSSFALRSVCLITAFARRNSCLQLSLPVSFLSLSLSFARILLFLSFLTVNSQNILLPRGRLCSTVTCGRKEIRLGSSAI